MADPTDIPGPLSDRSLVHGRNVMAAAGVILVLAYVSDIQIEDFEPLGFDFSKGGELSVWCLLAGVLVYYAFRFGADCWTDYRGWRDTYRGSLAVPSGTTRSDHVVARHVRRLYRKFWFWDVTIPAVMFLAAIFAAYQQIVALWN